MGCKTTHRRHISFMRRWSYSAFAAILSAGLVIALSSAAAYAGCLPGQTCWQPPQLQNSPLPTRRDDSSQQQSNQDRTTVLQQRQNLIQDRSNLLTPPATQTPLDRIQQREQLRQDRDQMLKSQQDQMQSQQRLLDSHRPAPPSPYIIQPK